MKTHLKQIISPQIILNYFAYHQNQLVESTISPFLMMTKSLSINCFKSKALRELIKMHNIESIKCQSLLKIIIIQNTGDRI